MISAEHTITLSLKQIQAQQEGIEFLVKQVFNINEDIEFKRAQNLSFL